MTYLPWAGSLESDSADTSPDSPIHPDRPANLDGRADPASRVGLDTPTGPPGSPSPASFDALSGGSQDGVHADSGAPGQAAALGQAISNRLFSVGFDLHFVMMTRYGGPGQRRLEHAITEIDDAIKELRHLMLAIMQRLA